MAQPVSQRLARVRVRSVTLAGVKSQRGGLPGRGAPLRPVRQHARACAGGNPHCTAPHIAGCPSQGETLCGIRRDTARREEGRRPKKDGRHPCQFSAAFPRPIPDRLGCQCLAGVRRFAPPYPACFSESHPDALRQPTGKMWSLRAPPRGACVRDSLLSIGDCVRTSNS